MLKVTVRKVGNSLGVILPANATKMLGVREGDSLILTESADGYKISKHDPEFKKQLEAAEDVMNRYRDTLRELSKK